MRKVAAAVAVALIVPLVAVAASRQDHTPTAAPSFKRDVAPILREKCTGCHQVGGIAPFTLATATLRLARSRMCDRLPRARVTSSYP